MKNVFKVLGVIAFVSITVFSMDSCGDKPDRSPASVKFIIRNGLNETISGSFLVRITNKDNDDYIPSGYDVNNRPPPSSLEPNETIEIGPFTVPWDDISGVYGFNLSASRSGGFGGSWDYWESTKPPSTIRFKITENTITSGNYSGQKYWEFVRE